MKNNSKRLACFVLSAVASVVFCPILSMADSITVSSSLGPSQTFSCPNPAFCDFQVFFAGATIHVIGAGNDIAPTVQLTANETASQAQTLTITYSASVAAGGSNWMQSFSGTFAQGPTVTANFSSYYNNLANLIFSQTIGGSGTVFAASANNSGSYALNGPFTLIEQYKLNLPSNTQSAGISGAFTVPEPASLSLLGFGFLALGTGIRKKLLSA